ncbi:MAG: hypothetical protein AAGI17_10440 [Planctomycetota bacterium]
MIRTLTIALLTAPVAAQQARPGSIFDRARPIEQGVGDIGPLSESQRVIPRPLNIAGNFDQAFEIDTQTGDRFIIRRSGAITALFPDSVYIPTPFGSLPAIPAGTVFVIGEPDPIFARQLGLLDPQADDDPEAEPSFVRSPLFIDMRAGPASEYAQLPALHPDPIELDPTQALDATIGPVEPLLIRAAAAEITRASRRRDR